jgi:4-amino-4-deoxy-L-arabinose transferase-like glycosyltransferase
MLDGQGYGPTAYFAPGMSFWLLLVYWLFGKSLLAAWLVNAAIGGVFTWLTYDVGRRVVAAPAARLAAVLAAVFPSLVLYATTLGNDPLLGCAIFTAVTLFLRRPPAGTHPVWYVALIGVVLGAVTFLKPIGLLLPAVFGLCYWRRGATLARSLRNGAILAVVLFATILPWSIRNVLVFGEYVAVTTGGGAALWMTNHPDATALSEPPPDFPAGTTEVQNDRILWKRSWEHILHHPDRFICMLLPKAAYLWGTSSTVVSTASADRWDPNVERAAKFVINVAWTFVCVLFVTAIWRDGLCRSTIAFWPVVCLLAYLWGIHLFYEAQSRYHLAFLPVLFIGAAAAMLRRPPVDA